MTTFKKVLEEQIDKCLTEPDKFEVNLKKLEEMLCLKQEK